VVCRFATGRTARLGDRAAEFARGLDPFVDHDFGVCDSFGVRLTIRHATRQFRHFDNEAFIVFAPKMISS
jgi:hypothetical protein